MADALDTAKPIKWPEPRNLVLTQMSQGMEARKSDLARERSEYLEEWRDISDYLQIRRGRFLVSENRKKRNNKKVLNERGVFASRTCGAGMLAGVSSPSRPWLRMTTPDKDLNEYTAVRRWLDMLEKRLYQVFSVSNYYHVKQSSYRDMADFGQGPVILDEDFENVINCYCSPPGEYYLDTNAYGIVDTMFRDLRRSTKQVVEEFAKYEHIPREIRAAYDRGAYQQMWDLVAVVQPNIKMVRGQRGPLGMPYSVVVYALGCSNVDDNNVLAVSGNWENAISAPRWDVQPSDTYGDGCGALALPATKSLQLLERKKGQLIDKLVTPPTQAPAGMDKQVISHMPGAVSYYPANAGGAGQNGPISPLYRLDPNSLTVAAQESAVLESRIDQAYFVDLFLATIAANRAAPGRAATAREINEVHEEKLIALGPVLERTHFEGLNHDVRRAVGILARNRVLPPPPKEMDGVGLKVEYTSLLAVAQKAIGAGAIERFVGFVGNIAAGDPRALDKVDLDQTIDEYGDVIGVPASMVRSDDEVQKLREGRQQQEQAMQAQAAAAQGADTAKVLSEADTGRNSNLLADIIGNQGRVI